MVSYAPIASRLLTVKPGQALVVRISKEDQVQGPKE
jgi:hypothetical protein